MKRLLLTIAIAIATLHATAYEGEKSGHTGYPYGFVTEPAAQAGAYIYAGTSLPYPTPGEDYAPADSLDVIFVNHVGRHGARFLSSGKFTSKLTEYLNKCDRLTPIGHNVKQLCKMVDSISSGRWGALDSLGIEEQSAIGRRFASRYSSLLQSNDSVTGAASYIPRCIMSMDQMTHGIALEKRDVELSTGSGKRFNRLLRFFETDSSYLALKSGGKIEKVWQAFCDTVCPTEPVKRLSETPCTLSDREARDLSMALYSVVSGSSCGTVNTDWRWFFTENEYRRLWECSNLKHYLTYSWSGLSDTPVAMATPLLEDLRRTLEDAATPGYAGPAAILRFGHAETMMPLLGLLGLPGCRYVTSDWGSVSTHWIDSEVAPMAVNLQMALCRSKSTGRLYLQVYLNEYPILPLMPWEQAQEWLKHPANGVCDVSDNKASL